MNNKNHDLKPIDGDYQHKALKQGHIAQRAWHSARLHHLLDTCAFTRNDRVADVGCGSAISLNVIAQKIQSGIGVDTNQQALDFCQSHYRSQTNLTFQFGTLENTQLPPSSCDKIICCEVIEHVYSHQVIKAVTHWKEILKPGGSLYLTTPNYHSFWPVLEWLLDHTHLIPQLAEEQHVSKWNANSLSKLLLDTGYQKVEVGSFNCLLPIATMMQNSKLIDLFTKLEKNLPAFCGLLLYAKATR